MEPRLERFFTLAAPWYWLLWLAVSPLAYLLRVSAHALAESVHHRQPSAAVRGVASLAGLGLALWLVWTVIRA